MMLSTKTSHSHPLRVDALTFGQGAIGLTFCPGKKQDNALSGRWDRDLDLDLESLVAWGCTEVLTLVEPLELEELNVPHLGASIQERGWTWHHWPITDREAPDHRFLERWTFEEDRLRQRIRMGGRLIIHCKGGLGRAGTVATMLLAMERPDEPIERQIAMVRSVRVGAIETRMQEQFLHAKRWLA